MLKKIIISTFILCTAGIAVLVYMINNKPEPIPDVPLIEAVPVNAGVILKTNNYSELLQNIKFKNNIWPALDSVEQFHTLTKNIYYIDSLIIARTKETELFAANSFIASIHPEGKKGYSVMYAMLMNSSKEKELAFELLNEHFGKQAEISKRSYNNETIYEVTLGNKEKLSFSSKNNFLLLSTSSILIEMALRQLQTNVSLLDQDSFERLYMATGRKVPASVFVNMQNTARAFSARVSKEYKSSFMQFSELAEWGCFDLEFNGNDLYLTGFFNSSDIKSQYLNIFKSQVPIEPEVQNVLPAHTSTFYAAGISNIERFKTDYYEYLMSREKVNDHQQRLMEIEGMLGYNVEELLYDLLENEMATAFTTINSLNFFENTYAILLTRSRQIAEEKMKACLEFYANMKNIDPSSLVQKYQFDEEKSFNIYHMPVKKLPEAVFGSFFSPVDAEYFTFIDNYLVFGNSFSSLSRYISDITLKQTLDKESEYNNFAETISDEYNYYFYSDINRSLQLYPQFLSKAPSAHLNDNVETYSKFDAFGFQLNQSGELMFSNILLSYNPNQEEKPMTVWESYLDTIIDFKPKLVLTHTSDNKYIFTQDIKNTVYLLNKEGRILWRKKLNEQINSPIYHIDFYDNGKYQYAFSTPNRLHIIDRIGNYVENYPINLESKATAGMVLVNYPNTKIYRIFVPTENKKVYCLDKNGRKVEGWVFGKTDSHVTNPLMYIEIDGKDYLCFSDRFNTYILNRKGEVRVKVDEKFEYSRNFFIYDELSDGMPPLLANTDKNGTVKLIDFDGNVTSIFIDRFSKDHYFEFKDFNHDGISDILIVDGSKLVVYTTDKKKIFEKTFSSPLTDRPIIFRFGKNDKKIGLVDQKNEKIYLVNSDGKLYNGFPLKGRSLFSIGRFKKKSKKFNLVVGSNDNFLYNYEVK